MRNFLLLSALALLTTSAAHAEPWAIDRANSRVAFSVPHMMVSDVEGRFHDVKGTIDLDDKDLTRSLIDLTIATGSIDTGNADRDKHLKSADFFDVEKFPAMTFKGSKIAKAGKNKFKVTGDLTIRDVTKAMTLDVTVSDPVTDPRGRLVRGVKVEGKVKRHDYGLHWNKTLDKGGVVVGDEVTLDVRFELSK